MSWPVLVFDIETIPDVLGLRALRGEPGDVSDAEVYGAWLQERQAKGQSDFLPLYLQRILVISVVFRNAEGMRVHSFVDKDGLSEGKVIQTFFNTLEKHAPQLVSWNGGGFDLPVLHYRGLKHGVVADKYWDMGEDDREFKWNNYISRYHMRHLDLMDLLAMYQPKNNANNAPLHAMARLCGFPGNLRPGRLSRVPGVSGGQARRYPALLRNRCHEHLPAYCRFQKMRGGLLGQEYEQEIAMVKETLGQLAPLESHWDEYLKAWA
jgi:hypothetical protein